MAFPLPVVRGADTVIGARAAISRSKLTAWPRRHDGAGGRDEKGRARSLTLRAAMGALLFLAACSAQPDGPGATTADEARQLNDAAAMLDANSVDADAIDPNQNESAP